MTIAEFTAAGTAANLAAINRILAPGTVIRYVVHDYDDSLELFLDPTTPVAWIPTEAQLKAVSALGFATVYCDFADDTEFVGCWRMRIVDGRKVAGGEYWVQSARREKVGYPRYNAG